MNIVTEIVEWQKIRKNIMQASIGFIPTMGHLHAGHQSLFDEARKNNDITVVSLFVNPTQFDRSEDYHLYPRTQNEDIDLLSQCHVDYVFIPQVDRMYPDHYSIQISESEISQELEGQYRPGHFNGMLTIVLKLLNLIQPTRAYFGEKDYQQLLLIKKMVESLFLNVEIIPCHTIRELDGVACSSRNTRLTQEQRKKAADFPVLLQSALSSEAIIEILTLKGFKVDYIVEKWGRRLGAVWLDNIRLIDNIGL